MNPRMLMRAVRFPRENNLLYPLPADYTELTGEGRRAARLNACCLQETPEDFVTAWEFFRGYYLNHDHSYWYMDTVCSPPLHWWYVYNIAAHWATIQAYPRGFSKSTLLKEIFMLEAVTRPGSRLGLVYVKDDFVRDTFDLFKTCFEENPRFIDDFGIMKPTRGHGIWDLRHLRLNNHTHIIGSSIEAKSRGGRFHHLAIDDPEYDPAKTTDRRQLTRAFTHKLTRVYMPMLKAHCRISISGTLSDRDLFMFHIATTTEDRRFMEPMWRRFITGVYAPNGSNIWPEVYTEEYLSRQRLILGEAGFNAEFMNMPGVTEGALFKITPDHEYNWVAPRETVDMRAVLRDPFSCTEPIRWVDVSKKGFSQQEVDYTPQEAPYNDVINSMYRFACVDYSVSTSPEADYSVILVMGVDRRNVLWVLDMWMGRVSEDTLMSRIWKMVERWRLRAVCPESVGLQLGFGKRVQVEIANRGASYDGPKPRVIQVKYPLSIEKEERIAGMEWRMNLGLCKFPGMMKFDEPMRELWYQVTNFSPEHRAIKHDDAVDTWAMSQFVVTGKGVAVTPGTSTGTVAEAIARGEFFIPGTKIPLTCGMDVSQLPMAAYNRLAQRHADEQAEALEVEKNRREIEQVMSWLGTGPV